MQFKCDICGRKGGFDEIATKSFDRSAQYNMPKGTFTENVNYCADNDECKEKAETFTRLKGKN